MPQGAIKKKSTAAKLSIKSSHRQSVPKKGKIIRLFIQAHVYVAKLASYVKRSVQAHLVLVKVFTTVNQYKFSFYLS